jgi:hypothetical protein
MDDVATLPLEAAPMNRRKVPRFGLADLALLRVATAPKGIARTAVAKDLAALTGAGRKADIEAALLGLALKGQVTGPSGSLAATPAGQIAALASLGGRPPHKAMPKSWDDVIAGPVAALALGLDGEPPSRIKKLARPEELRAAVLREKFKLKIKGAPSPGRLREALALIALEKAFGNRLLQPDPNGKTGLSPKAGRELASQLSRRSKVYATDGRLVAALAAEAVRASGEDHGALLKALVCRLVGAADEGEGQARASVKSRKAPRPEAVKPDVAAAAAEVSRDVRPDLATFAEGVRRAAATCAHGFPGNRKAYISDVWQAVRAMHAAWQLTEIEFKAMLIEGHRTGALSLANADLTDASNFARVQESAVTFKNSTLHVVRVDV